MRILPFISATTTTLLLGAMAFLIATAFSRCAKASVDYGPAISKAQEAFMIQSGAAAVISSLKDYSENKAKYYVYHLISPTLLDPILALSYGAYKQEFQFKFFTSPLKKELKHSLYVSTSVINFITVLEF